MHKLYAGQSSKTMLCRLVLILYMILIRTYVDSIQDETFKMIISIIIFIIALAFTIGGGKGAMQFGRLFKFSR